jgi:hypothetical protein
VQYAGGGGGGVGSTGYGGLGCSGGGNGITFLQYASPALFIQPTSGLANTGGGGGGSGGSRDSGAVAVLSGAGGSGIVILRYPSYLAPATSTTGSPETYVTGFWRVYRFVASGTITF